MLNNIVFSVTVRKIVHIINVKLSKFLKQILENVFQVINDIIQVKRLFRNFLRQL